MLTFWTLGPENSAHKAVERGDAIGNLLPQMMGKIPSSNGRPDGGQEPFRSTPFLALPV